MLPAHLELTPAWHDICTELRRASATVSMRSGSPRCRSPRGTARSCWRRRPSTEALDRRSLRARSSSAARATFSATTSASRSPVEPAPGRADAPLRAPAPALDPSRSDFNPRYTLRAVHHRRRQPPGPRRGPGGRRGSPARPTTRSSCTRRRGWQDAPPPCDRQLHARLRRRRHRPLHDRRGLHERLHRRARTRGARALQARSTARSTCC